jgi:hypothetical protein
VNARSVIIENGIDERFMEQHSRADISVYHMHDVDVRASVALIQRIAQSEAGHGLVAHGHIFSVASEVAAVAAQCGQMKGFDPSVDMMSLRTQWTRAGLGSFRRVERALERFPELRAMLHNHLAAGLQ